MICNKLWRMIFQPLTDQEFSTRTQSPQMISQIVLISSLNSNECSSVTVTWYRRTFAKFRIIVFKQCLLFRGSHCSEFMYDRFGCCHTKMATDNFIRYCFTRIPPRYYHGICIELDSNTSTIKYSKNSAGSPPLGNSTCSHWNFQLAFPEEIYPEVYALVCFGVSWSQNDCDIFSPFFCVVRFSCKKCPHLPWQYQS